jgi:phenylpyruvate tautomerase PptA (4-oxalocrotonate tautomerase family)
MAGDRIRADPALTPCAHGSEKPAQTKGKSMPMIELTLPKGALDSQQIKTLMHRATKTLMWWEKIPDTAEARAIAWAMVNEIDQSHFTVGGLPPELPRYRFRIHTIEGLMDDGARQGVMRDLTKLVLEIEGAPHTADNAARVWTIMRDYPRSHWGIGGYPFPPAGFQTASSQIQFGPEDKVR